MKKVLAIIVVAMVAGMALADSWSVTVGTNAVVVAPAFDPSFKLADGTYTNFYTLEDYNSRTNVYTQGEYMTLNKVRYWTPNGGTSTNAPSHLMGVATGADGVTWVVLNKYKVHQSMIVSLTDDSDTVYLDDNATATTNGTPLRGTLPALPYGGYTGYVSGITATGSARVTVKINY